MLGCWFPCLVACLLWYLLVYFHVCLLYCFGCLHSFYLYLPATVYMLADSVFSRSCGLSCCRTLRDIFVFQEKQLLPNMEFGRRIAIEREIEKSDLLRMANAGIEWLKLPMGRRPVIPAFPFLFSLFAG